MPARQEIIDVEGRKIALSNLDKVLNPSVRFTKGQVIDYYVRISKHLLPHLKDRPITLVRYPNAVRGEFFYEKDAPLFTPDWVQRRPLPDTARRDRECRKIRGSGLWPFDKALILHDCFRNDADVSSRQDRRFSARVPAMLAFAGQTGAKEQFRILLRCQAALDG